MTNPQEHGYGARLLLKQQSNGVLSTHSVDVEGYPFGSITPYTLNPAGEPIILISNIAQHTRNIQNNPKVSLTIFDASAEDTQANSRLTWIGDAETVPISDSESRRRYLSYFPSSASYFEMHDFMLYRIKLVRARFIGGFGQIYWLEPSSIIIGNPLSGVEADIIEHMNKDHRESLFNYCRVMKGIVANDVSMVGIDSEGFDLLADKRKIRFEFDTPVNTAEEARVMLVKLARSCR